MCYGKGVDKRRRVAINISVSLTVANHKGTEGERVCWDDRKAGPHHAASIRVE